MINKCLIWADDIAQEWLFPSRGDTGCFLTNQARPLAELVIVGGTILLPYSCAISLQSLRSEMAVTLAQLTPLMAS